MNDYETFESWANSYDHDSHEWEDMGRDTVFIAGMKAAREAGNTEGMSLTVDTREDDAVLAKKVRMALRMAGGQPIMMSASDDLRTAASQSEPPFGISSEITKMDQLRVFRDLLMGADIEDLKREYELDDIEYGGAIESGLEATNEVLGLALDPLAMEASFYCEGGKDTWVYRAMLAIEQIRQNPDSGTTNRG